MPLALHLSECLCWSTNLGFSFLGHIVSSYIHMHNDQISYSNDIGFFIYQTSGHLANLDLDCPPATFEGLRLRPPLDEVLPLPLELFLPLPLPRLMDDCAANAPSNDIFVLLIRCS